MMMLYSIVEEDERIVKALHSPGTWLDDPDMVVLHLLEGEDQKSSILPDPCRTVVVVVVAVVAVVVLVVDGQDKGEDYYTQSLN